MGLCLILRNEWKGSKLLDKIMYILNTIFAFVLLYGYRSYMDVDKMLLNYNTFFIIYGILLVLSIISTVSNHRRNKEIIKLEGNIKDINDENAEDKKLIYEQKRQEISTLGDQIAFYKDKADNWKEKAFLFEKEQNNFEKELLKTQEKLDKVTNNLKDAHENIQKLNEVVVKTKKVIKLRKYAYRKCKERCETLEKENYELKGKPRIKVENSSLILSFNDIRLKVHTVEDRLEDETLLGKEADSLANELENEL